MDDLEVLQGAVGERRVDQEGFSYPWLSKEYHYVLTRFEALHKYLQSSSMALARKEPVGMRCRRERIPLQSIIIEHSGHEQPSRPWTQG
jgi:hypothetical protein